MHEPRALRLALALWCQAAAIMAYHIGDVQNALCFANQTAIQCGENVVACGENHVEFTGDSEVILASELVADRVYLISYRIFIEENNATHLDHVNLHSCPIGVFCTPFVQNTPSLSTQSPEQQPRLVKSSEPGLLMAEVGSSLSLSAGQYTVIVHARWNTLSGVKMDMVSGMHASHVDVSPTLQAVRTEGLCLFSCYALICPHVGVCATWSARSRSNPRLGLHRARCCKLHHRASRPRLLLSRQA